LLQQIFHTSDFKALKQGGITVVLKPFFALKYPILQKNLLKDKFSKIAKLAYNASVWQKTGGFG
jgi:hypothetical protein